MMSETGKQRTDQAENLRTKMIDDYKEQHGDYPPRGEVHKNSEKKSKLKLKYPIISLLALFFCLVPVLIFSFYLYYNGDKSTSNDNEETVGNDTVYIPKKTDHNDSKITEETANEAEETVSNEPDESVETDSQPEENVVTEEVDQSSEEQADKQPKENEISKNSTTVTESKPTTPNVPEYRDIKTHKVGAGETLFKIAIKYYNSRSGEEIIRQYNGLNGNDIYEGQLLKIPIK